MEKPIIKEWFESYWDKVFHGEGTRRQELKAHLNALLEQDLQPSNLNEQLVAQTRASLLRVPVSQRVYSRIKSHSEYNQRVDMLNFYGESVRTAFKMDERAQSALSIPALYTIQGYKNVDFSVDSPVVSDVINERWILADDDDKNVDFVNQDLDEISEQVKEHYLADYTKIWTNVYDSLHVANFSSLREVNDVLTSMVDPVYSPLLSVLQVGKTNTQLTPPLLDNLADKTAEGTRTDRAVDYMAIKLEGTIVDKSFHE